MAKNKVSTEVQDEALLIAKKIQKSGQTKDQTKLIAQGIQKGIAEYKKSAKNKLRQTDKYNKKKKKEQFAKLVDHETKEESQGNKSLTPWLLLAVSWIGFITYFFITE